jgi:hypothetical protein
LRRILKSSPAHILKPTDPTDALAGLGKENSKNDKMLGTISHKTFWFKSIPQTTLGRCKRR